ncbi:hypothetical protein [Rubrivirga sp.]|uniref:hypothetical protein n=1 Tax=Rubrivirga sp. TaxID=1885344 RepID=UPI003C72A186
MGNTSSFITQRLEDGVLGWLTVLAGGDEGRRKVAPSSRAAQASARLVGVLEDEAR